MQCGRRPNDKYILIGRALMDKLRWGLLSTARINRAVIPPIRLSHRSELLGVASRELVKAQAYAHQWDIPRAYGSYSALLADPDISVVYNPLPNHLHAAWSIKCAEAGKHVLCEKPFALSVAEVDRVMAAARANNVIIAEALMYRHHPQTLKVLELLEQHAIGELIAIKSAFTFTLDRAGDVRWSPERGGGSIWDVGCYPISFACLIAQAAPVEVFGWQQLGASGVDVAFAGQLRFAGGLVAQIECSFSSPYRTWLEVVGTQGALYVDKPFKPAGDVAINLNYEDRVEIIKVRDHALYQGEIEDMERAVLGGQPPRIPLTDSRIVVATISALLESARSGLMVRL
jgi:D-xylose 1-dehydrogenase (NADP+, D-xylono-1,5-lactone-forming)